MAVPSFFNFDREAVYLALFNLMVPAYAWKNTPTRRVKLWTDVPPEARPAMYQFEGHDETWNYSNSANPTVYLEASIFIYTSCPDPEIGATILNNVLNAVTARLLPTGRDITTGRQTLGGLVQWARIQGSVTRVPGDIDGDGMAIVPIRILVNG
jgi:hypothetical protein